MSTAIYLLRSLYTLSFVFAGPADHDQPAAKDISDFDRFWASDFKLTLRPGHPSPLVPAIRQRSDFRMLHALHRDQFRSALDGLSPERRGALEEFTEYTVGSATDWNSCRDKWKEIRDNDSLLHIFGHSDGEKIYLKDGASSDAYCLEADRFRGLFAKDRKTKSATITIINGCQTGAGPVGESFLDVMFHHGFQGFIGTEAKVTNKFAAEYASEFIARILTGKSVRKVFDELRLELYPQSLLYSCYADPDFCLSESNRK